jgi:basic membrane protein A and related proteins
MLKHSRLLGLVGALALLGGACGGAGGPCDPGDNAAEDGIGVGVAFDVGGLGDRSFNDSAKRGLDASIQEGLVSEADCIEPNATGSNRDDNMVNLADAGYDLLMGIGFVFSEGVAEIAADYPDQNFGIIDGFATTIATDAPNIVDLTFKEQEGSYLVGIAAAMASQTGTIGFLGGQQGQGIIEKFEAGFTAGAQSVNPDIEVLVEYIGDDTTAFNDPTRGEALATSLYDDGADVVYHAAGESGLGLFKAAVAAGPDALAIGVDSDQYLTASPEEQEHILTSMIKRVDTATHDTIQAMQEGSFEPGFRVFGIADGGIEYSKSNPDLLTPEMMAAMDEASQAIVDGDIVPPEEPEA